MFFAGIVAIKMFCHIKGFKKSFPVRPVLNRSLCDNIMSMWQHKNFNFIPSSIVLRWPTWVCQYVGRYSTNGGAIGAGIIYLVNISAHHVAHRLGIQMNLTGHLIAPWPKSVRFSLEILRSLGTPSNTLLYQTLIDRLLRGTLQTN